jgi:hypothetical protein
MSKSGIRRKINYDVNIPIYSYIAAIGGDHEFFKVTSMIPKVSKRCVPEKIATLRGDQKLVGLS